jgi:hypothetical protein
MTQLLRDLIPRPLSKRESRIFTRLFFKNFFCLNPGMINYSQKEYISWLRVYFLLTLLAGLLLGCLPKSNAAKDYEIVEGRIGQQNFYIPKIYFAQEGTKKIGEKDFYIRAMYPDFSPLTESSEDIRKRGEWYKNISILSHLYPKPRPIDKFAKDNIEYLKATEVVGTEFGLIHQTQPSNQTQDLDDVWLEKNGDEFVSFIQCNEKIDEISVPQCSQYIRIEGLTVKSRFDKRLLSDWEIIKKNVIALHESFKSAESARKFIQSTLKN